MPLAPATLRCLPRGLMLSLSSAPLLTAASVPREAQSVAVNPLRAITLALACAGVLGTITALPAHAQAPAAVQDDRFNIIEFVITGNSIVTNAEAQALVAPFTGAKRNFADVQRALEALQAAYAERGLTAVQVLLPEQTLDAGRVTLRVIEAKVAEVRVKGNNFHSRENVLRALPSLKVGSIPSAQAISANVQAANENPNRSVEVAMSAGAKEEDVIAEVRVTDNKPWKVFLTLENTGSNTTGKHLLGIGAQHANLWDRDHVGTLQYTTTVEKPSQVKIWSVGYRVPFYELGSSFDAYAAKSSVNAGTTSTIAGPLTFSGKGTVWGLRYNQALPRIGEYSQKLVAGFDYRDSKSTCTLGAFGAAGCGGSAYPTTLRPFSLAYSGEWTRVDSQTGFTVSGHRNWSGGKNGSNLAFDLAKGGGVGNLPTATGMDAGYFVFRGQASHSHLLPMQFMLRAAVNVQYAGKPLLSSEQFGYAGSQAVRGFTERELTRDRGYFTNIELYSPDWGKSLHDKASVRALVFADFGGGRSYAFGGAKPNDESIASVGLGLRASYDKNLSLKVDLARVTNAGGRQGRGDSMVHLGLVVSY
jgi:hemolysin activation/secretion protein